MVTKHEIRNMGTEIAKKLKDAGYDKPEKIADANLVDLISKAGIEENVAASIIEMAKRMAVKPSKQEMTIKEKIQVPIKEETKAKEEVQSFKKVETLAVKSASKVTAKDILIQAITAKLSKKLKKKLIVEESAQKLNLRDEIIKEMVTNKDARKTLVSRIASKIID